MIKYIYQSIYTLFDRRGITVSSRYKIDEDELVIKKYFVKNIKDENKNFYSK